MRIGLIGAGKVATQLALAWRDCKDVELVGVWSKTESSAKSLAEKMGCAYAWGDFKHLFAADVYVISVKDDVVAAVVKDLHQVMPQALLLHTAGSVALSVFEEQGCERGGVLYPMQSFTKEKRVDCSKVSCFIESLRDDDLDLIQRIATTLMPLEHIHELSSAERKQLHVAAVFVSNFVNHCCVVAEEVLKPMGLSFDVMQPLLEETIEKLKMMSPRQAQTGPAIRGDKAVMAAHQKMLEQMPEAQQLYKLMSEGIQNYKE